MDEQNKIVTVVELNAQQAQQELVKLNATVSNSTKTLEERIEAKNKAIEIQNSLSKKTIAALENERRTLEGRGAAERELQAIFEKLNKAKLDALKVSERSKVEIDKLTAANDKYISKLEEEAAAVKKLESTTINLNSSFEEVYGSLQPLNTRMGEAEDRLYELAAAGKTTSQEYTDLLAVVANYKKIQQETDRVVDAAATTMSQNLAGAANVVATSFQVLESGLAVVGVESEKTAEVLLKVQASMAFADGIKSLTEMGGQFRAFKTLIVNSYLQMTTAKTADAVATEAGIVVENQSTASKIKSTVVLGAQTVATNIATAAQWLWNTAVMANPIVALVVALAAAAAGIYYFTKMLVDSSEANDKAAAGTKTLEKALDKESITLAKTGNAVRDKNKQTLAMAKANGESSESIRKLEKKLIDEQIATDKASTITARNTFIQERNNLAKLKASDASDEVIKAREKEVAVAYQIFQRENKQLDSSYKERAQLVKNHEVQIATERTEARKKAVEDSKKSQKDRDDAAKKKADADAKTAKEALELKKRQLAAEISLAETDVSAKKAKDPKVDTLDAEKKILDKKKEYELLTEQLLVDEKLAIKAKYNEQELELDLKQAEKKRKIEEENYKLQQEAKLLDLEARQEIDRIEFDSKSATILERNAFDIAQLQARSDAELANTLLTEAQKAKITKDTLNQIAIMNKQATIANKASVDQQADDGINALAESFGIAKEVAVAKMIIAAPEAIGNSFKNAAAAYVPPVSIAMGALGAATTVVPIIKGLTDIKKTRFPGKGGSSGGGGSISSPTGATSVSKAAVGDLAANNLAQLGVDPSVKSAATADAANNVSGSTGREIVFSEGKYSDFKNQVDFKEQKTSI